MPRKVPRIRVSHCIFFIAGNLTPLEPGTPSAGVSRTRFDLMQRSACDGGIEISHKAGVIMKFSNATLTSFLAAAMCLLAPMAMAQQDPSAPAPVAFNSRLPPLAAPPRAAPPLPGVGFPRPIPQTRSSSQELSPIITLLPGQSFIPWDRQGGLAIFLTRRCLLLNLER